MKTVQSKLIKTPEFPYSTLVYGDYVITPCKGVFNNKWSFWISKKGCTKAIYCFSLDPDDRKHFDYMVLNLQQYVDLFESQGRKNVIDQQLLRHKAYKSLSYEEYCDCVSGFMLSYGYSLTNFIQNMNYRLRDVKSDLDKIQTFTEELSNKIKKNKNEIHYKEEDAHGIDTYGFKITGWNFGSLSYYEFTGIVTKF